MIKLYNNDSLKVLSTLEDKSIDLIFTSPPFKEKDLHMSIEEYWSWYDSLFIQLNRIARKAIVIIHSATKMNYIIQHYPPKRTMIWGKQTERFYAASWRYNPIFVYQLDDNYNVNKQIWGDAFAISSIRTKDKIHPYEDPLLLYTTIIKMFKNCNIILDPFMGSGTSGVACKKLNKDYIGIEIDKDIFNLAENRINNI